MKDKPSDDLSGLIITISSVGLAIVLNHAEVVDFPVIAAGLDWITEGLYHIAPPLTQLPSGSAMWIGPVLVGVFAFIMATVIVAVANPSSAMSSMEAQLRRRQRQPRRVKIR